MTTRKSLILLALALTQATSLMAEQRSEIEAQQIAAQYMAQKQGKAATMRRAAMKSAPQSEALTTPYYIYNSEEGGFVVVSGTTALSPVIASSTSGRIPEGTDAGMPDGLRYWLDYAARCAAYAEAHPGAVAPHPAEAGRYAPTPGMQLEMPDYYADIAPLLENSRLGNIKWGQGAPFNEQCPTQGGQRCYTGCMATAMAQVMAYHQYPAAYDWTQILPSYQATATAGQRAEVARLNHEVGVALSMQYGTDQSGSVSTQYAKALHSRFGYHPNVALISRDDFTYGEWIDILLNELKQNRPVIYDGVSADGGHAFVVDGYRGSDGFVHVNWGWEGLSDGYYNIILLNPQQTGVGAVLSSGFTAYQDAVVGIEPDASKQVNYYLPIQGYGMQGELQITAGRVETSRGEGGYMKPLYMSNLKSETFEGEYGALFVNAEGREVARVKAGRVSASASTMQSNPHADFEDGHFSVPDLPDGTYRGYLYIADSGSGNWAVARTCINKPNFFTMTLAGTEAHFDISAHTPTGLKAAAWSFDTQAAEYGSEGITLTLTNEGQEVEYGSLALSIEVPGELSRNYYDEFHRLLPGESEEITFPVLFTQYGEYTISSLELLRLGGGGKADIIEPGSVKFSVVRSLAEMLDQLSARIDEVQEILTTARRSGNYSSEACDALQQAIDAIKATSTGTLTAEDVADLLQQLDEALRAFYATIDEMKTKKSYWGYVDGTEAQVNTSWCPGDTRPGYFGISIPPSTLRAYEGGQIIGLRCLFGQNRWYDFTADDIIAQVFLLDYDGSYPGTTILATSQKFSPSHYAVYHEYLFDQPFTIGQSGVICCAEVYTPHQGGMYGAMGACKDVVQEGACWMNNGSGWEDMVGYYGSQASGVAIQAIIVAGEPNGVATIHADEASGLLSSRTASTLYDLQGRSYVRQPKSGLFIQGGRKVIR